MAERGVEVDHSSVDRWVQKFTPQLEAAFRKGNKHPISKSWRMDETYMEIKGQWKYLYRAVDKAGQTIDFLLTAPTRADAGRAFDRFLAVYRPKYPKAADCLPKDRAALLAFYDFPAEHWPHLRTTNPTPSSPPSPPFDYELTRPGAASPVIASWPWCSCW